MAFLLKNILGTNFRLSGAIDASGAPAEPNRGVKACSAEHWINGREWTYKGFLLYNTKLLVTVCVGTENVGYPGDREIT